MEFIEDVDFRWGSCLQMFERALLFRSAIDKIIKMTTEISHLGTFDWELPEDIILFLGPFHHVTQRLCVGVVGIFRSYQ